MGDLIGWLILFGLVFVGLVVHIELKKTRRECPFCQGTGYAGQRCHVCEGKKYL